MSTEKPTPPPEKKPRSNAASLAGIRVASDDEIRAAAKAEITRIRAEIAHQKKAEKSAAETAQPTRKATAPSAAPVTPEKKTEPTFAESRTPAKNVTSPRTTRAPRSPETPVPAKKETAALEVNAIEEPQDTTSTSVAEKPATAARVRLSERISHSFQRAAPAAEFNIKRWEPTPEEAALIRSRKVRRLRVTVALTGAVFLGLLGIIIYLSTGGLIHPTQGVTTEWGTATQVNTLVDRFSTPRAGSHVIVHLPNNDTAEVLGFLQGFDGENYLVTIGENTITVPQSDYVGKVTAIWPDFFPGN